MGWTGKDAARTGKDAAKNLWFFHYIVIFEEKHSIHEIYEGSQCEEMESMKAPNLTEIKAFMEFMKAPDLKQT